MPSHRRLLAAAITATVVAMLGLLAVAGASAAVGEFASPGSLVSGVVGGLAAGGLVLVAGAVACLAALRSVGRPGAGVAPGWGWAVPGSRRRLDGGQHADRRGLRTDQSVVIAGTVLSSPLVATAAAWGVLELWAWRRRFA